MPGQHAGTRSQSGNSRSASHRSANFSFRTRGRGTQRSSTQRESTDRTRTTSSESSFPVAQSSSRSLVPLIGYHHVLMFFLSMPIIFMSIVMAGCTATGGIQRLHLASFSYRQNPPVYEVGGLLMNKTLQDIMFNWTVRSASNAVRVEEVQAGYLGICVKLEQMGWHCGLKGSTVPGLDVFDPLGLVETSHHFRTQMVTCGLIIICLILAVVVIALLASFPGFKEDDTEGSNREVKPFPYREISRWVLIASGFGSIGIFISITWQHIIVASVAAVVEGLRYDAVEVHVGTAAAVLSWLSVLLYAISLIGIALMTISMKILSSLA